MGGAANTPTQGTADLLRSTVKLVGWYFALSLLIMCACVLTMFIFSNPFSIKFWSTLRMAPKTEVDMYNVAGAIVHHALISLILLENVVDIYFLYGCNSLKNSKTSVNSFVGDSAVLDMAYHKEVRKLIDKMVRLFPVYFTASAVFSTILAYIPDMYQFRYNLLPMLVCYGFFRFHAVGPINRLLSNMLVNSGNSQSIAKSISGSGNLASSGSDVEEGIAGARRGWSSISPGAAYFIRGFLNVWYTALYGYVLNKTLENPSPLFFFIFRLTVHVALTETVSTATRYLALAHPMGTPASNIYAHLSSLFYGYIGRIYFLNNFTSEGGVALACFCLTVWDVLLTLTSRWRDARLAYLKSLITRTFKVGDMVNLDDEEPSKVDDYSSKENVFTAQRILLTMPVEISSVFVMYIYRILYYFTYYYPTLDYTPHIFKNMAIQFAFTIITSFCITLISLTKLNYYPLEKFWNEMLAHKNLYILGLLFKAFIAMILLNTEAYNLVLYLSIAQTNGVLLN